MRRATAMRWKRGYLEERPARGGRGVKSRRCIPFWCVCMRKPSQDMDPPNPFASQTAPAEPSTNPPHPPLTTELTNNPLLLPRVRWKTLSSVRRQRSRALSVGKVLLAMADPAAPGKIKGRVGGEGFHEGGRGAGG
jgi:hypothetical protein